MQTYNLEREVGGRELVGILRRASSDRGFIFTNVTAGLPKFGQNESKGVAKYRAEKIHKIDTSEITNLLAPLDTTPCFAVEFPRIDENARYHSVNCQAQLGTMSLEEIDINRHPEYKPDYDALIAKIIELSRA